MDSLPGRPFVCQGHCVRSASAGKRNDRQYDHCHRNDTVFCAPGFGGGRQEQQSKGQDGLMLERNETKMFVRSANRCMHACMHITFLYRAEQKTDGWIHSLVPFFFSVRKETQGSCTMFDY
mmetsp:Transcript_21844/g.47524  ORF Transcript_21844/g.47524 Transcript_21844/m.47524 type:complete len:121 (-) Transcript_21844:82-444(-)